MSYRYSSALLGLIITLALSMGSCKTKQKAEAQTTAKTEAQAQAQADTSKENFDDYKTFPSGTKYKIHTSNTGEKAEVGKIAITQLQYSTADGEVIFENFESKEPVPFLVKVPQFNGDFQEGLPLMSIGDSATFIVSTDSIAKITPLPPGIGLGSYIRYDVKVLEIYTQEEYQEIMIKQNMANAAAQKKQDSAIIQEYLKINNLQANKTPSGLYYIKSGEPKKDALQAEAGKKVDVHYTGKLLDGTKFDSSRDRGQPISFVLGKGEVIKGWDEGIALLKEGEKATLIIPSGLAYGSRDMGPIPGNSVLIFDVELVDVK